MPGSWFAGRMQMDKSKRYNDGSRIDPATDGRLAGDDWFPPQGHPGSVDGVPGYGPSNGETDTYVAAETGLGRRIRGFRGLYDMHQSSLAAELNVPEETIDAWETAMEQPTVRQLSHMCDVFKTTPNGLLMGPFYVQPGPLRGLGQHLETLPGELQLAILFMVRSYCQASKREPPRVF